MLGEQDTAGGTADVKQQDEGISAEPVTPTRSNNNDESSSDRQQTSQVKMPASKHASKPTNPPANQPTNQRTTAKSRK